MENKIKVILAVGKHEDKNFACTELVINNKVVDKVIYASKIFSVYDLAINCVEKILLSCKGKNVSLYQHSDLLDKQKNEEYRNRLFLIQKKFVGRLDVLVSAPRCIELANQTKNNINDFPLDEAIFPNKIGFRKSYQLYDTPQQKQYIEFKNELLNLCDELLFEQQQNLLNYARGMVASNTLENKSTTSKQNKI